MATLINVWQYCPLDYSKIVLFAITLPSIKNIHRLIVKIFNDKASIKRQQAVDLLIWRFGAGSIMCTLPYGVWVRLDSISISISNTCYRMYLFYIIVVVRHNRLREGNTR